MHATHFPGRGLPSVEHGGPDGGPALRHDFSTNANPIEPPPQLWEALAAADRRRYPDPHYHALREALAPTLGRPADGLLPTAGSSEAIRRLTLAAARHGRRTVWVPAPGYADYAAAAQALGLPLRPYADADELLGGLRRHGEAALVWLNEPHNPSGRSWPPEVWQALGEWAESIGAWLALDRAYEPLRLVGNDPVPPAVADQCWQLISPNKALGLTGVRAGLLVAPVQASPHLLSTLLALAPSWVLSAEGEALLRAAHTPATQTWLADCRQTLREWRSQQALRLVGLGWVLQDSCTSFWLARPPLPAAVLSQALAGWREDGLKLRDARAFGLPGWVRVSTQPPTSQQALVDAWRSRFPARQLDPA